MSARNCPNCRRWEGCKSLHDYFLPSDINRTHGGMDHVCHYQLFWLISWLVLLSTYRWPPEYTGYTDELGHSAVKSHGSFEEVSVIYYSLDRRLKKCGPDGVTLVEEILNGLTLATISTAAMNALRYCVGREKTLDYRVWVWRKEHDKQMAT